MSLALEKLKALEAGHQSMDARLRAVEERGGRTATPAKRRPRRRRRPPAAGVALTDAQREAVEAMARHDSNRSAAARDIGISRQALNERVGQAAAKLRAMGHDVPARGAAGGPARRTVALPTDARGGAVVDADRSARVGRRGCRGPQGS